MKTRDARFRTRQIQKFYANRCRICAEVKKSHIFTDKDLESVKAFKVFFVFRSVVTVNPFIPKILKKII